ncbi:MAG: hypothetical protein KDD49_04250 [Bacteroidetes bacterium]|nr:hypothetical protein [Bacteroidota bacterium]MCB9044327.1 hypothetical protein [Chitinophagales bacterium]
MQSTKKIILTETLKDLNYKLTRFSAAFTPKNAHQNAPQNSPPSKEEYPKGEEVEENNKKIKAYPKEEVEENNKKTKKEQNKIKVNENYKQINNLPYDLLLQTVVDEFGGKKTHH